MSTAGAVAALNRPLTRRRVLVIAGGILVASAIGARAAERQYRIVFISNALPVQDMVARRSTDPAPKIIESGLRDLGWIDGKNLRLVFKSANGDLSRLTAVAREAVAEKPDMILAFGPGVGAVARETATIPVVMVTSGTPVEDGLVKSLAHPGGNITGMTLESGTGLFRKRLSLMKSALPSLRRIALITTPMAGGGVPPMGPKTAAALKDLGLEATIVTYERTAEIGDAIKEGARRGAQGFVLPDRPDLHLPAYQKLVHEAALKHRQAAMHTLLSAAETGGLMAFDADINENCRRAPYFIDRILRGVKPADIPIEQPSKFEFVVNLRAAKQLGVTIAPAALIQASRVIE